MGYLTDNKPKCLVPVENLPMIFHLFRKYPDSKFIIIGDYHYEVLKRYLTSFADVDYQLVCATEKKGTCSRYAGSVLYDSRGDAVFSHLVRLNYA